MSTRQLSREEITKPVIEAIGTIFRTPDPEVLSALARACEQESSELARDMLSAMLQNAEIGAREHLPVCQDTGTVVVFAELGNQIQIQDGTLSDLLSNAVTSAWNQYHLRWSIAANPLFDRSVQDPRIPVVLNIEHTCGSKLVLQIMLKGGGAENMSRLKMFTPSATEDEVEDFIVETVVQAGGKPCPPVIVGVGIGGNFEQCALLAKKALLVPQHRHHSDPRYRELEMDILERINESGKGVQGMGGTTTALAVHILTAPCHIASLPVAVNLECHSHRWIRIEV